MIKKPIKVGVIGCGKMGQNHVRLLSEMTATFKLVGIYDPDDEKREIADRYGTVFYYDYKNLIADCAAVTIACPTTLHKKMALEAKWGGCSYFS